LGFGFLRTPFIVSGSLNGYMLETDPVVPSHAPVFDAELVWEADKRRFRSLRVQNVPVKVEVFTTSTQGRKDKVGYLLLSLLGAQPCPSNKIVEIKHSWHRLLGVKSEGKCCHPQLLMSLSIEDRINTPTPKPPNLTARSASRLQSGGREGVPHEPNLDFRSGSCTNLGRDVGQVAYTSVGPMNTGRKIEIFVDPRLGDAVIQSTEIADLIKKMCESLALSQEKLLASQPRPVTADMQVQCEDMLGDSNSEPALTAHGHGNRTMILETSKSDTCIMKNDKEKLLDAKKALESDYTAKYQELREASQKMEDDMNHQLKLKDMKVEELQLQVEQLQKQVELLKRYLEEKLDSAVQSKAFFKEQWGRAVRELHLVKLATRKQMLSQLQQDRKQLDHMRLDTIEDEEENRTNQNPIDLKKLKDDFYVDILANTPALNTHSLINPSGPDELEMFTDLKLLRPINTVH
ncbi:hypothetical protein HF086_001967, partial [Spodoptera exigua]